MQIKNGHARISWTKGCTVLCWLLACAFAGTLRAQTPEDSRPVILAIGESTTAGFGVPADRSYPAQLQQLLDSAGYRYRVVNHGRSGSTTAMALGALDRGMLLQPEIVLIALGGNDQSSRMAAMRTEQNLRKLVSMFVHAGARVFLADRNPEADRVRADDAALYARLAQQEGATLMPSLRQDVAAHPGLLLADMSHPNAEGYAIVAQRIFTLLEPALVRRAE